MKGLRIVLLGLGVLLAGTALAAWVVPGQLDWTRHRDTVEALASSVIGRPVTLSGDLRVSLLPVAVLEAGRLSVAGADDGVDISADAVSLRVGLLPLLRGRVDAQQLVLRGAVLRVPWPPASNGRALQPPTWLTGLSARFENSRAEIGTLRLDGLSGTVASLGPAALEVRANGLVDRRPLRLLATLGRAGGDGAAPLELLAELPGASIRVSGILAEEGSFAGRVEAATADLSAYLRAPPVPARLSGRLSADAAQITADDLSGELAGSGVRAALTLTLGARPRLDAALAATQLDLDGWLAALTAPGRPSLPTGLDLSVEAAALAGGTVRRVRATLELAEAGVAVRELEALLPGDAQLHLAGTLSRSGDTRRFRGPARLVAPDPSATMAWLVHGLPPGLTRLGAADLAGEVEAEDGRAALVGLRGTVGGVRVSGRAGIAFIPRPRIQLAIEAAEVALEPPQGLALLPGGAAEAPELELTLAAPRATLRGQVLSGLLLDIHRTPSRLHMRRVEAGLAGARFSGAIALAADGRISDGRAELTAPDIAALHGLLPPSWRAAAGAWRGPARLQLQLAGPPNALSAGLLAEAAEARLQTDLTIDTVEWRAAGPVAIQHPGAPRFLALFGWSDTPSWLGDGSFALTGALAASRQSIGIEGGSLTAGLLRGGASLTWAIGAAHLSGGIQAETLPLPLPYARAPDPLPLGHLLGWSAEVAITSQRVLAGGSPLLAGMAARLTLRDGRLSVSDLGGTVAGGQLAGRLALDAAATPPALAASLRLADATIAAPLLDQPIDLAAGRADATLELEAAGHSPAALLASARGMVALAVRDGVLTGFDLGATGAALIADAREAAPALLRRALTGGATAFERLDLSASVERGGARLTQGSLTAEAGLARATGSIDLGQNAYALRWTLRPALADAPELGLTITGTADQPQRAPELAAALRWLAQRQ